MRGGGEGAENEGNLKRNIAPWKRLAGFRPLGKGPGARSQELGWSLGGRRCGLPFGALVSSSHGVTEHGPAARQQQLLGTNASVLKAFGKSGTNLPFAWHQPFMNIMKECKQRSPMN